VRRLVGQHAGHAQLVRVRRAVGILRGGGRQLLQASRGKYKISINFLSTSSDQQRVSLVRRLAANDPSIDILAMDVDWTAEFATAKWIQPVPASLAAQIRSQDLVQQFGGPPKTWTQMIADATKLAKEHGVHPAGLRGRGLKRDVDTSVEHSTHKRSRVVVTCGSGNGQHPSGSLPEFGELQSGCSGLVRATWERFGAGPMALHRSQERDLWAIE
jgi:Bacterial extracellular solute-binding protein